MERYSFGCVGALVLLSATIFLCLLGKNLIMEDFLEYKICFDKGWKTTIALNLLENASKSIGIFDILKCASSSWKTFFTSLPTQLK